MQATTSRVSSLVYGCTATPSGSNLGYFTATVNGDGMPSYRGPILLSVDFATWATKRLLALITHGVGLVSTLVTVALFVLPSFASGVPRWWALAPLMAFIIGALLKDEYDRVNAPCLTAELVREQIGSRDYRQTFLEIRNCGLVTIERVECQLSSATQGWDLLTDALEYPVSELEPGARVRFLLVISMGCSAQARVTLRGAVDGRPYERTRLLGVYG